MRSASEGPPKRLESISGVRPRAADSGVAPVALASVFCWFMLHLRRLLRLGSMAMVVVVVVVGGINLIDRFGGVYRAIWRVMDSLRGPRIK